MVTNQTATITPGLTQPVPASLPPVSNTPASMPDTSKTSTNNPDQLSNLLEVKLDDIAFPVINFTENGSQSLAVHEYPNLDSARVENTGRKPSLYSCRAVLTNNIYPSSKESWKAGSLFPTVFENLLNTLYDSSGYSVLQHPFLGNRNVMVISWNYVFAGQGPRDGVFLDMKFIETIGDDNINTTISSPNSLADMQNTGASIDTQIVSTPLQAMNPPNLNLAQYFSKIAGVIKNVVSFPQQTIGAINAQLVQVNSAVQNAGAAIAIALPQLVQSGQSIVNQNKGLILHGPIANAYYYDKAAAAQVFNFNQDKINNVYFTASALNSNNNNNAAQLISNTIAFTIAMIEHYESLNRVETSVIKLNLYLFLGQLQKVLTNLFNNNRNFMVRTYVVKVPTTLLGLSKVLNNSVNQLIQLNSHLNKLYLVDQGTIIKYYQG